jgi:hypothetical protein
MNEVLKICGQEVVWLIHIFIYSPFHVMWRRFAVFSLAEYIIWCRLQKT